VRRRFSSSPNPYQSYLLGDLAYRSAELEETLAECGLLLVSGGASARRPGVKQQVEIAFSSLKRVFGLGETLATTLVELATRIVTKMTPTTPMLSMQHPSGAPPTAKPKRMIIRNLQMSVCRMSEFYCALLGAPSSPLRSPPRLSFGANSCQLTG
jgi:hypothetical protein